MRPHIEGDRAAGCGHVEQRAEIVGGAERLVIHMAAGLTTLQKLKTADYAGLAARTKDLAEALAGILRVKGVPVCLNQAASLFTLFFCDGPVTNFDQAKTGDTQRYAAFYTQMREAGVLLAPSAYECAFTSFAHSEDDFARTLDAARRVTF